jgi:Ca2+-binding RTX toxin-like protein
MSAISMHPTSSSTWFEEEREMAKHTIKHDRDTPWVIDGDNATWTLKQNAEISAFGAAVHVLATSEGNTLKLLGDIEAQGALTSRGVLVEGDATTVLVGEKSEISGRIGIRSAAGEFELRNEGAIDGIKHGISTAESALIENHGSIGGEIGIQSVGGSRIVNGKHGEITGTDFGIEISSGHGAEVINRGTIASDGIAISMTSLSVNEIRNFGTILGDVVLGNGIDVLDTRKGTIDGSVIGGGGSDVYRIGQTDLDIVEEAGNGDERVEAWASYALPDNVEDLTLKGKSDLDGTGNGEDNIIYGNAGNNQLSGGGGEDVLNGGSGDDKLTGNGDGDTFVFHRDAGHDRVMDFQQGIDLIHMIFEGVNSYDDIEDAISQHGNDVWISMGQGDRLILKNTDIGDVDAGDFDLTYIGTG